ncbi:MAG: LytTR family transcriptional regulator [Marinilabiliaceae bacterium]|nr:LytTR family transcriptional regulator [Marinilabiliaceae bacterium]
MIKTRLSYLHRYYPPNYLLHKPLTGALIVGVFFLLFTVIYQPLEAHPSPSFTFLQTMALYAFCATLSVFISVHLVKRMGWLADEKKWTVLRELVAIALVLVGGGIFIYCFGFIMEPPMDRLNMMTFFNSVKVVFFLELLPFVFFTAINYGRFKRQQPDGDTKKKTGAVNADVELIEVASQLKKEEFQFLPDDFLYAEAEGNYVAFYLKNGDDIRKVMIRNSMTSIAQQLSPHAAFFRSHRAYIINLNKVQSRHGNALGYRLKIEGVHFEIPVSRSNIKSFDQQYAFCRC